MMVINRPLALVTGASSGLGASFAKHLAARGYDLLLVARRADRLRELQEQIEGKFPARVNILVADLSLERGMLKVVNAIEQLERLDLLVNNAGFGSRGSFADRQVDHWQVMLSVHCDAVVRFTHAALQKMRSAQSGSIINVASISAFVPQVGNVMYSATKAFLVNFSKALQKEHKRDGIHVQVLCPGFFHSEFHDVMKVNKRSIPAFFFSSADRMAQSSLAALDHKRVVVTPGLFYQVAIFIIRIPGLGEGLLNLFSGLVGRWRRDFLREG